MSAWVPAQPQTVLALLSDTRNDPLWCSNVDSAQLVGSEPIGVGSKFTFRQILNRGARRFEFDADVEITELTDTSIRWTVSDKLSVRDIAMTVNPEGAGTRVRQTTRAAFVKPPGILKWVYPVMARRVFKAQFRDLAEYLATDRG